MKTSYNKNTICYHYRKGDLYKMFFVNIGIFSKTHFKKTRIIYEHTVSGHLNLTRENKKCPKKVAFNEQSQLKLFYV
jgi:hypothetical protein